MSVYTFYVSLARLLISGGWVGITHAESTCLVSFNRIDRTNCLHTSPLLKSSVTTPTQNPLTVCDNMESLPTGTFMY